MEMLSMSTDAPQAPAAPEAPATPEAQQQDDGSSKPGRKKQNKIEYRGKDDPKLTEWPADYDPRVHKPLHADDFEAEDVYWDKKAEDYDKRAKQCRKNADLFRKFGSAENRKSVEKLNKMQDKIAQLRAELEASGIQIDDQGNVIG